MCFLGLLGLVYLRRAALTGGAQAHGYGQLTPSPGSADRGDRQFKFGRNAGGLLLAFAEFCLNLTKFLTSSGAYVSSINKGPRRGLVLKSTSSPFVCP